MTLTITTFNLSTKRIGTFLFILFNVWNIATFGQNFNNLKSQKPVSISGSFEGRGTFYQASGIENRRQPFSSLLNGAATLSVYGLSIPFSVSYSEADRSFSQPFNQFGLSPTYKWITVHGGYRNIDYSPYTLGGHTMLGAGLELNPGKFRFGFMHGRLNRATTVDSTTQAFVPISFSRVGTAAKLGYGTDRNMFEFSYLQARDDSTSVNSNAIPAENYITPASNNVVGYNSKFSFLKYFTIESRGAVSIYTRDINSTFDFDVSKNKILKALQEVTKFNGSSEFYSAFDATIGYRSKYFGLKADYKRIDPDYKTMGAYFFNSDLESYTFGPSFALFKSKVRINGSIGTQRDNLLGQKRSTNKRFIGSANASIEFNKSIALDMAYANFSNDQVPNTLRFPDSLRIVQTTKNLSVTPRYTVIRPDIVQVFSLSASINSLNDYNQIITSDQVVNRNIDTRQFFFSYIANLPKKGINLFLNVNRTELQSETFNNTYQGVTIGANSTMLKSKLQLGLNNSFIQSKAQTGTTLIVNSSGNATYKITKKQILRTTLFFTGNKPPADGKQKAYTEFRNELSYLINL